MKLSKSEAGKLGAVKSVQVCQQQLRDRINSYNLDPKLCLNCSCGLLYEKRHNKFCSKSCSASYNNELRGKTINPQTGKVVKIKQLKVCEFCGNSYTSKRSESRTCSNECDNKRKVKERLEEWFSSGKRPSKRTVKEFLLAEQNGKCASCGISTVWNGKPLVFDLEHKDGDSENNTRENLELLCPNCHSQTDTYKAKNKGNGRHARRQRYQDGKSY